MSRRLAWREYAKARFGCRPRRRAQKLSELEIVAVNAGCKLCSSLLIEAWLANARFFGIDPDLLFVSELDGKKCKHGRFAVPGYVVWRHWAGPGSRAMAIIIKSSVLPFVKWRRWSGRASGLLLGDESGGRLFLAGVHCAHGLPLLQQSLSDLVGLLRAKPRMVPWAALGDWNIDLLPSMQGDPICRMCRQSFAPC